MPEKFSLTAKAMGERIDAFATASKVNAIMSLAQVSEEDAQWMLDCGYWEKVMHGVRSAVALRYMSREKGVNLTGDEDLGEDPGGQVEVRGD